MTGGVGDVRSRVAFGWNDLERKAISVLVGLANFKREVCVHIGCGDTRLDGRAVVVRADGRFSSHKDRGNVDGLRRWVGQVCNARWTTTGRVVEVVAAVVVDGHGAFVGHDADAIARPTVARQIVGVAAVLGEGQRRRRSLAEFLVVDRGAGWKVDPVQVAVQVQGHFVSARVGTGALVFKGEITCNEVGGR